jgi:hypothetical protein
MQGTRSFNALSKYLYKFGPIYFFNYKLFFLKGFEQEVVTLKTEVLYRKNYISYKIPLTAKIMYYHH